MKAEESEDVPLFSDTKPSHIVHSMHCMYIKSLTALIQIIRITQVNFLFIALQLNHLLS